MPAVGPIRDPRLLLLVTASSALGVGEVSAQDGGGLVARVVSTIASEAPQPVAGVTVVVVELGLVTTTDDDGRSAFGALPARTYQVVADVLGCRLGSSTVRVRRGRATTVEFVLDRPIIAIPGLLARGVADRPRYLDAPYSVGRVDRSRLERYPARTIAELIRGAFPGAEIVQGSGLAGSEISIQFRGPRSIRSARGPLVVVDGVVTGGGSIDLNPRDVEDIVVLKGAAAAAHYGSRGQAGVIEITTRRDASGSGRSDPWVIVDGTLSARGLEAVDAAEIASMEVMGGGVARVLFGPEAPAAGVVRIATRGGVTQSPSHSCFEPRDPPR